MASEKIRTICLTGISAAVIAVLSQIIIPMPYGVPMTLQTFIIPLIGLVFGSKRGAAAAGIYIAMGALGLPVFAGFSGGIHMLIGPTGGFILSFPLMAYLSGFGKNSGKLGKYLWLLAASALNLLCGMLMFAFVTKVSPMAAFTASVLPFIPTAILKIALCGILSKPMLIHNL